MTIYLNLFHLPTFPYIIGTKTIWSFIFFEITM